MQHADETRSPGRDLVYALGLAAILAAIIVVRALAPIEVSKSPNDEANYRTLTLENRLQVLLVSDAEADKAAAALAVNVGSSADPKARDGLAHFLEHMLFLGTERYPEAGEYQAFINAHGGSHNAYTGFELTNYFFDVDPDYLAGALDRFSQFFVSPLFSPTYVQREKNAVDSEYRSDLKSDGRRQIDAQKELLNPAHPYARFRGGNLETLSDRPDSTIRDELIEFYRRHYSANLMTLVVLGRESLDEIEELVRERFSAIPNADIVLPRQREPLFEPDTLPVRMNIEPYKDVRQLELEFPIPPVWEHYRSKPTNYLTDLLGDEGKGSLLSLLKAKGWVDELSAGNGADNRDDATLALSMSLTADGLGHVNDVIAHCFQYLRLIREQGVHAWMFEQQSSLAAIDFRFLEKPDPLGYVTGLAASLHVYPTEDVLRGPYALDEFEPRLIRRYLSYLTPDNVLVTVTAKGLPTDRLAPWFDTPYQVVRISPDTLRDWRTSPVDPALFLPEPNPFIPGDLEVESVVDAAPVPALIIDRPGFKLWHQQDETFKQPRADFFFSLRSELSHDTPEHAVLTDLYVDMVNDQLNEFAYPATLAGLGYDLYPHLRGLSLRISGYDDKQRVLLQRVVQTLSSPALAPERFLILKERLLRELKNAQQDRPYSRTLSEVSELLLRPSWSEDRKIATLEPLTLEDLREFVPRLLERVSIVALSHGNVAPPEASAMAAIVTRGLLEGAVPTPVSDAEVVRLAPGDSFVRELRIDHDDSAITVYFQGDDRSFSSRAKAALITRILSSPFYTELRTEQQLGYIVFPTLSTLRDVPGVSLVVQSPTSDPVALEHHIEEFIERFVAQLESMTPAELEEHKEGIITLITEQEKTLEDRSDRYWQEIDKRAFGFDTREKLAGAVRALTSSELVGFYRSLLLDGGRKRLVVRTAGNRHRDVVGASGKEILVPDSDSFKDGKSFFPTPDEEERLPEAA